MSLAARRPVGQYGGTARRLERRERRQPFAEPGSAGRERKAARDVSVLVLDEHQVRSLLTMGECIDAMDEVLRSLARGELHQPLRPVTRPEGADTLLGLMPAYRGGEQAAWSLKEIVIAPGNPARGLDAHQGAVLLHDGETGELRALLNASAITEIRTAAVSAVATRALARPGSRVVAILGGGVQARSHHEAMRAVLPDAEIRTWKRARRRHARGRS